MAGDVNSSALEELRFLYDLRGLKIRALEAELARVAREHGLIDDALQACIRERDAARGELQRAYAEIDRMNTALRKIAEVAETLEP